MDEAGLIAWCRAAAANGIEQHSAEWLAVKKFTVGGSSLATVMGLNAFQSLREMLLMRLGVRHFNSDIKPQWGNMLEEVIKREIEHMYQCRVHGEDLYLSGHIYGTSYSPDGLAIIDGKLVLLEFKCPYSRIPSSEPPKYYVPQVKMGLVLIPEADYGLYAEAVYRRCSWDQLGPSGNFDTTLVSKPARPITPISYGFVGFYTTDTIISQTQADLAAGTYRYPAPPAPPAYKRTYTTEVAEYGDDDLHDATAANNAPIEDNPLQIPGFANEYGEFVSQANDLGESSPDLMRALMHALDTGRLRAYYSETLREFNPSRANHAINGELAKYTEFIGNGGHTNYGVLPWKLLRIAQHRIDRETDYLEPYVETIAKIVDFVKSCNGITEHGILTQKVEDFVSDLNGEQIEQYEDDV